MSDRSQERAAIALFMHAFRQVRSVALVIAEDNHDDFPDFVLSNTADSKDVWVEVVEAVESGQLLAAERRAQRLYGVAARDHRARGEEVVLTVSPQGVESVTLSPGFGVTGVLVPGPARRISPPEWIAKALERKGRANRYGLAERERTTLLIDCCREVLIEMEDVLEVRRQLNGNTLGFKEVWSVSSNWATPKPFASLRNVGELAFGRMSNHSGAGRRLASARRGCSPCKRTLAGDRPQREAACDRMSGQNASVKGG